MAWYSSHTENFHLTRVQRVKLYGEVGLDNNRSNNLGYELHGGIFAEFGFGESEDGEHYVVVSQISDRRRKDNWDHPETDPVKVVTFKVLSSSQLVSDGILRKIGERASTILGEKTLEATVKA